MFNEINNELLKRINAELQEGEKVQDLGDLYNLIRTEEYSAMCAGWCMALGLEIPDDCSKETNLK